MQFSNDGVTWSGWQAWSPTTAWSLAGGDGMKIVYFRFRDSGANVSAAFGDTITLDGTAPTGSIAVNAGAANTNSILVTLALSASDAGSGMAQMRFSNNGSNWSAWQPYAASEIWALAAGDGIKTVYVQYRDVVGNVSNFSDTIRLDTAAPTGNVTVNAGAAWTNQTAVSLGLSASDSGSGVAQMAFSHDGSSWTAWQPYAASAPWTLLSGDGPKTVYVQFRDNANNVSLAASDSIGLDTALPTGSIVINGGAARTTTTLVMLNLSATDALSGVAQMRFNNNATSWSPWEAYATRKTWNLLAGDGSKIVYVQFRDAAGNISATYNDAILLQTPLTRGRDWTRYR